MQTKSDADLLVHKFLRGLADPSRFTILSCLTEKSMTVNELVAGTGLGQPNVSNHLACLKECGLVDCTSEGRFVHYSLSNQRIADLLLLVRSVTADVAGQVKQCRNYE
ncbi:MAG: transcriptional regulator [Candidatus Melainabacteria bacterium]|jgi:DNA-binding transcriptional ArsR family regulator|nr:helix-turn-helix transcriptional regulator [Candidatus Melainabacteria bacterium]RTL37227.1 MAG: transcriptional regulator [Candidatus Melainabacteria bacterium]